MKRKTIKHHIDALIALVLFGVFAVCVLAVLLTSADAYRRLTARDQAAYDRRTCVQYVATRVRQSDCMDSVALEEFGGASSLVLGAGAEFVTRIYYYDGWLMELYAASGGQFSPEDGERIMESGGLELTLEDDLLTVTATDLDGVETTLLLSLRSEQDHAYAPFDGDGFTGVSPAEPDSPDQDPIDGSSQAEDGEESPSEEEGAQL